MLYICGTPIGNLEDITLRQLNTLKAVDIIAAEDTRHSLKLLNYYNIKCPLISYHHHNKKARSKYLIDQLDQGKKIALITDGGMPAVSDPGWDMVLLCKEMGIQITTVPGPTALISGLVLSGFDTTSFAFEGFLDKKNKRQMNRLVLEERTIILYEAPHKLVKTLLFLQSILGGHRPMATARELTKKFEEISHFTISEAIQYYEKNRPQGEFVLIIQGKEHEERQWDISIKDHVEIYLKKGHTKMEAIKMVAKERGVGKREVYIADVLQKHEYKTQDFCRKTRK